MTTCEITTKGDEEQGLRRFVVEEFQANPLEAEGLPAGIKEANCVGDGVYVVTVKPSQVVPHSQLGQDLWVLAQLNHKRGGVFVDVGAHDGMHFSNTYLLEKEYGWTGVCVEPHPETYQDLRLNRECECLNIAAWSETGKVLQFNEHPQHPMLSGVLETGSTKVETLSLNGICEGLGSIDYLSLDTEGTEPEILSTFDIEKYKPQCMTIEHNMNSEALNYMLRLFDKHGYLWRVWHWDVLAVRDRWRG